MDRMPRVARRAASLIACCLLAAACSEPLAAPPNEPIRIVRVAGAPVRVMEVPAHPPEAPVPAPDRAAEMVDLDRDAREEAAQSGARALDPFRLRHADLPGGPV